MAEKTDLSSVAQKICATKSFIFQSSVGNGEFKQTFHVTDPQKNSYALKIFFQGASSERQEREISAMMRCIHPSIAKLAEVSTSHFDGLEYLWLLEEFLDGGTLTTRIEKGPLNKEKILEYGIHLISAISHLKFLNLVHRDLKPDNIMFRRSSEVPVIVDFGLVRDLSRTSLTQTWAGRGPGTPLFSSPEQLNNEKELIDWRSDQFAIGTIFSIAMFNIHPYQYNKENFTVSIERVEKRLPQSPTFIQVAKEAGMEILIRMTAPWPHQRFRTPSELNNSWQK